MYLITGIACTFNPTSGRSITSAGVVLQAIRDPLNPRRPRERPSLYEGRGDELVGSLQRQKSLSSWPSDSLTEVVTSGLPAKSFNPAVGFQIILPVPPARVALAAARLEVGAEHDRDRVAANRHRRGSPGGAVGDGPRSRTGRPRSRCDRGRPRPAAVGSCWWRCRPRGGRRRAEELVSESLMMTFVEPVPSHPATIELGSIGSLKVKVMVSPSSRRLSVGRWCWGLHVDRRRRDVVGDRDRGEVAVEGASMAL